MRDSATPSFFASVGKSWNAGQLRAISFTLSQAWIVHAAPLRAVPTRSSALSAKRF
jgi:hypothetical protein